MDEGYLKDTLDKTGSFADAVIIYTSNAEAGWCVDQFNNGIIPEETEIRDRLVANGHFKPEFLNRLDAIIPFSPITKEDLVKILDIQMKRMHSMLGEKKITLEISKEAKMYLVEEGYSPEFGARPLKRVIDTFLGDKLSEMIIGGEVKSGQQVNVDIEGDKLSFSAA